MGIAAEDVGRVRESTDLVALVAELGSVKKVGQRFQALCPFHTEKTPSFSINPTEGLYYCFGCQVSGDAITFVRETQHLGFVEAVEVLAGRAGVTLRYDDPTESDGHRHRALLTEALTRAVAWYHQRLLNAPDAAPAKAYLKSRGYDADTALRFQLGWAPNEPDALVQALELPEELLVETGLARRRDARLLDTFRGRVLFPVFDHRDSPVGFGGRILPGADGPKYLNSPAGPLYDKSRVLYGLNWARTEMAKVGEVIVCEGYTDVIGLSRAGLGRAVAPCGTALTEHHLATLARYARRVVLAFDADAAGRGAAERVHEWERRHDLEVVVAGLPAGTDPGELAERDPDALRAALDASEPLLGFRVGRSLADADLSTVESRVRTAETALRLVAEHPNPLVRDQYLVRVAEHCNLPADQLRSAAPRPDRPAREPEERTSTTDEETMERTALRLAIHRPEAVAWGIDRTLFADEVAVAALRALEDAETIPEATDMAPPEAATLLHRLVVEEEPDADPVQVLARLADAAACRELNRLQAEALSSSDPLTCLAHIAQLRLKVEDTRSERPDPAAITELVQWLGERAPSAREVPSLS